MKRRRHRNKGAFGGQKKKKGSSAGYDLRLDLTGPEFDGSAPVEAWDHSDPDFADRLKGLDWYEEWETIWDRLLLRYKVDPLRPHSVYEAFIRGARGYIPMIFMSTSPEGTFQARGMLCSCGLNPEGAKEDTMEALYKLGASAVTQFLAEATGDPNYFVRWVKPPKF
jgi:hypothetical protein